MIERQYIVDYDIVVDGKVVKWGNQSFHTRSWFPVNAGMLSDEVRKDAADYANVEPSQIRITGVFKL